MGLRDILSRGRREFELQRARPRWWEFCWRLCQIPALVWWHQTLAIVFLPSQNKLLWWAWQGNVLSIFFNVWQVLDDCQFCQFSGVGLFFSFFPSFPSEVLVSLLAKLRAAYLGALHILAIPFLPFPWQRSSARLSLSLGQCPVVRGSVLWPGSSSRLCDGSADRTQVSPWD